MAQDFKSLNKDFNKQLKRFIKNSDKKGTKAIRGVGLKALSLLVYKSPVDEGVFRANWNAGINKLDESYNLEYTNAQGAKSKGEGRIGSVDSGDEINLSNALPYAMRLEYGYSSQAPEGMVRTTLTELTFWLKAQNKKL